MSYCKRCGYNPCICICKKSCREPECDCKPCKPPCPSRPCPRPPKNCKEALYNVLLYNLKQDFDCKVFPNTCCNWYEPYYGKNAVFPAKYMFNQACRTNSCGCNHRHK